ncbi:unnamed protein product [Amoebophrya sp. A25]|nr:unnamed protein product [Amoebophrya sp. A25]|eukprot:GSA25T00001162001.1
MSSTVDKMADITSENELFGEENVVASSVSSDGAAAKNAEKSFTARAVDAWMNDYDSEEDDSYVPDEEEDSDEEMNELADNGYFHLPDVGGTVLPGRAGRASSSGSSAGSSSEDGAPTRIGPLPMLHRAVFQSKTLEDFKEATALLLQKPESERDLGCRDGLGRTALHLACQHAKKEIVRYILWELCTDMATRAKMLAQRFKAKTSDGNGVPLLHIALSSAGFDEFEEEALEIVKMLLDAAEETDAFLAKGRAKEKKQLENNASTSSTGGSVGQPPQVPDVVGEMIDDERDCPLRDEVLHAEDSHGQNALHIACDIGCSPIVRLLIEKGLDANGHDRCGLCPIHYAVDRQDMATFETIAAFSPLETDHFLESPEAMPATETGGTEIMDKIGAHQHNKPSSEEEEDNSNMKVPSLPHQAAPAGEPDAVEGGKVPRSASLNAASEGSSKLGGPRSRSGSKIGTASTLAGVSSGKPKSTVPGTTGASSSTASTGPNTIVANEINVPAESSSSAASEDKPASGASNSLVGSENKSLGAGKFLSGTGNGTKKAEKSSKRDRLGRFASDKREKRAARGDGADGDDDSASEPSTGRGQYSSDFDEFDSDSSSSSGENEGPSSPHPAFRCIDRCAFGLLKRLKQLRGITPRLEKKLIAHAEEEFGLGDRARDSLASVCMKSAEEVAAIFRARVPGWDRLVWKTEEGVIIGSQFGGPRNRGGSADSAEEAGATLSEREGKDEDVTMNTSATGGDTPASNGKLTSDKTSSTAATSASKQRTNSEQDGAAAEPTSRSGNATSSATSTGDVTRIGSDTIARGGAPFVDQATRALEESGNKTWIVTHKDCYGHGEIPGEDEAFPEHGYFDCDDPALRYRVITNTFENPHRLETLVAPAPIGCLRTREFVGLPNGGATSSSASSSTAKGESDDTDEAAAGREHPTASSGEKADVSLTNITGRSATFSGEPSSSVTEMKEQCAGMSSTTASVTDTTMEPAAAQLSSATPRTGGLSGHGADQSRCVLKIDSPDCPLHDILRCHELPYIKKLEATVKKCQQPRLGENGMPMTTCGKRVTLDKGDTKVTQYSYRAARRAAGCVLEAVDLIMTGKAENAFCAVRPPGHHMGPAGAVDAADLADEPEGSQGFCLLNNVAIGAAYARACWRQQIKKVAIVDFDVHHGNGTEAIVRNVSAQGRRKWKNSWRTETSSEAYGKVTTIHEPPTNEKPWKDPQSDVQEVFFASIHGYGGGFYPGSGRTLLQPSSASCPEIVNIGLQTAMGDVPGADSQDFRKACSEKLLPRLLEFKPDMLFISAGFDGHEEDFLGQCNYQYDDFTWITQQLLSIANVCCEGRVVSVLEGGYNTRAGYLSPFARSVRQHIRVLMSHAKEAKPQHLLGKKKRAREAETAEQAAANKRPKVAGPAKPEGGYWWNQTAGNGVHPAW